VTNRRNAARKRPWDDPKSYALSVLGALLLLLGLTVADSVALATIGALLIVAGFIVSRRKR
jgi:hypothetical protein